MTILKVTVQIFRPNIKDEIEIPLFDNAHEMAKEMKLEEIVRIVNAHRVKEARAQWRQRTVLALGRGEL